MNIRLSLVSLFFAFAGTVANASETTLAPRDTSQLHIASGSAMLVDLQTNKVIYASNPDVVVPIASVTKLMTGMVVLDARTQDAAGVLQAADMACYSAKQAGRNRLVLAL